MTTVQTRAIARHPDHVMTAHGEIDANRTSDLDEATRSLIAITKGLESAYAALERRAERVEAELERTNRELSAILDALPCGVIVRDRTGRVSRTNRAAEGSSRSATAPSRWRSGRAVRQRRAR